MNMNHVTVQRNLSCVRCGNILPITPYYPRQRYAFLLPHGLFTRVSKPAQNDVSVVEVKTATKFPRHRHRPCRQSRQPNPARDHRSTRKNNDNTKRNPPFQRMMATSTAAMHLAQKPVYVLCLRIAQKGFKHYHA